MRYLGPAGQSVYALLVDHRRETGVVPKGLKIYRKDGTLEYWGN